MHSKQLVGWQQDGVKYSLKCTAGRWSISKVHHVWSVIHSCVEYNMLIMPDYLTEHYKVFEVHSRFTWSIVPESCLTVSPNVDTYFHSPGVV